MMRRASRCTLPLSRRTLPMWAVLLAGVPAWLSACEPVRQVAQRRQFVAPGVGANHYVTASEVPAPEGTSPEKGRVVPTPASFTKVGVLHDDRLPQTIERSGQRSRMPLENDERLNRLARWVAQDLREGHAMPAHALVDFLARHTGLVEPAPHLVVIGDTRVEGVLQGLSERMSQHLGAHSYSHYGAAMVSDPGRVLGVVVLSWRWLTLEPVPRALRLGQPIQLRGQLADGYRQPVAAVTVPDGGGLRQAAGSGRDIVLDVPTERAGTYQVELLAKGPRGDTVVANFPVYVGITPPERLAFQAATEGVADVSPEAVQVSLITRIHAARQAAGLHALRVDDALSEVGRRHSADMARHRFVAHTSPTTGQPVDRVAAAGIHTRVLLENIGRGYSAEEIHRGLMNSPGHRANILHRDVEDLGVGVVLEADGERQAFLVTQLFARLPRAIDVEAAPRELLQRVQAARREQAAPPLVRDAPLAEAAQRAAERFFQSPNVQQDAVLNEATAQLGPRTAELGAIGGLMWVGDALEAAAEVEVLQDPGLRHVGIGVAQGERPDTGPHTIAVVYLFSRVGEGGRQPPAPEGRR